ncbi:uncharacterized protein LOC129716134 [Leucoraja erinacea]|uniref:uncharacterized protein LOC129716134 n=1 Tax=Leucoraja erinaceus TaxID=7782 RepID=UPI0024586670|nr:uncharacterized protein LOC129716134 [Leucoraja erinacea]
MAPSRSLLRVLDELSASDLSRFVFLLADGAGDGETIPRGRLEGETREGIASLLRRHFAGRAMAVTRKILLEVPRRDLVEGMLAVDEDHARGSTPERKRAIPEVQDGGGTVCGTPAPKKIREITKTLTDRQLMKLATKMGHNWKQIGIQFLQLQDYEIQRCEQEPCAVMRTFSMLRLWRDRGKNEATASHLHSILGTRDCPISSECIDWLLEDKE